MAGKPVFVDLDGNGAADAGASTNAVTITRAQGEDYLGAKTLPGGDDDPANPSGLFPVDGEISVEVTGVGAGAAWLVVYENGGDSTFLEIDDDGKPTEVHAIGGRAEVQADGMPDVTPTYERSLPAGEVASYAITDLDDSLAYRVTLVVAENVSWGMDEAMFVDADASGTADAGPSETRAVLVSINGMEIDAAKTFPAGSDDPASPSGIYPENGRIVIDVMGVDAGSIVPVAYENGGASTFLEVDSDGVPVEAYGVGGALRVE